MNHVGRISKGALCALMSVLMAVSLLLFGAIGALLGTNLDPTKPAFASSAIKAVKGTTSSIKVKGAKTSGVWQYKANKDGKDTITIVAYTGKAKHLKVPAKIKGKTVTRVTFIVPGSSIGMDDDYDGTLPESVTAVDTSALGSHLRVLSACDSSLTSVNVKKNRNLKTLDCEDSLTSLDLSHNPALKTLNCEFNDLSSLDLSHNTALTSLECMAGLKSQVTSLDLSKNKALTYVDCSSNHLSSLDLSAETALKTLLCNYNQLISIKLPTSSKLSYVDCDSNKLTALDFGCAPALDTLICNDNALTSLDVTKNVKMTDLYCDDNQLATLDITKDSALNSFDCSHNNLTSLDIPKNILTGPYADAACAYNRIADISALESRFGYNATMPQDVSVAYPLPVSKYDLSYTASFTYNQKAHSAQVVAAWDESADQQITGPFGQPEGFKHTKRLDLGTITTYYRENGSNAYTTTAPVKADRYKVYVKTSGSSTFAAQTSYLYIGTMTIKPHAVSLLSLVPHNKGMEVWWKDYSTNADDVSYYRVYYRKAGSSKWQYKTCKVDAGDMTVVDNGKLVATYQTAFLTKLTNNHKYYVKVRAYRSVSGTDVASAFSPAKEVMVKKTPLM